MSPRILALDTATEGCSVAVLTGDGMFGECREVGRGHAEVILGMVDSALARAGVTLSSLDGIVASVGPGAFTGVRISVSVAQGLAFGAELPVVAVTTLEALALQAVRGGAAQVLAALDARMGELYWGCFSADSERGVIERLPLAVGSAASIAAAWPTAWAGVCEAVVGGGAVRGIGRGFAAYPELATLPGLALPVGAAAALPDARDMARLGALRLVAGLGMDPADLLPRYLRDKVAFTEIERAAAKQSLI